MYKCLQKNSAVETIHQKTNTSLNLLALHGMGWEEPSSQ